MIIDTRRKCVPSRSVAFSIIAGLQGLGSYSISLFLFYLASGFSIVNSMRMTLDRYSHTRSNRPTTKVSQLSRSLTLTVHARLFLFTITPLLAFSRFVRSTSRSIGIARISAKRYVKQTADQLVALIEKNIPFSPAFSLRWDRRSCLSSEEAFTRKCFVAPRCRYICHTDYGAFYFTFLEKNTGHEFAIDRNHFIIWLSIHSIWYINMNILQNHLRISS